MTIVSRQARGSDRVHRDFDIELDVGGRVLKPHGELDMATSPLLLAAARAFAQELPGDLTIDFAAVTFGDSALLNALIDIRHDQHEQGHRMNIANETAAIRRLFLLSGFRAKK